MIKKIFFLFDPVSGVALHQWSITADTIEAYNDMVSQETIIAQFGGLHPAVFLAKEHKNFQKTLDYATEKNPNNWVPVQMDETDEDVKGGWLQKFSRNGQGQIIKQSLQDQQNLLNFVSKKGKILKIVKDELFKEQVKLAPDAQKIATLEASIQEIKDLTIQDEAELYIENFIGV